MFKFLWQLNRRADFFHRLLSDDAGTIGSVVENVRQQVRLGGEFSTFGAERLEILVKIFCVKQFAFHAADSQRGGIPH